MDDMEHIFVGEYWLRKLKAVKIRKKDEKKLVMNFLIRKSSFETVKNFIAESGTEAGGIGIALLTDLQPILKDVDAGNYGDVIKKLNDFYPEILNTNHRLYFRLHLQRFIELGLTGDVHAAVDFGMVLARWCRQNQFPDEEIGRLSASLVLEKREELLDEARRSKNSKEINEVILTSLGLEKEANLDRLLKMLLDAQNWLDEVAAYPHINDLANATLDDGATWSSIEKIRENIRVYRTDKDFDEMLRQSKVMNQDLQF
ncbi:LisH motif-containing protein [Dioscorea alata]|uniref:LisH motif-containing protein n=1 Tax=Dioscorea alata TaxID=55571 RepID=A0ACB7VXS4_DIOAL|nr:LisH motif-containing protein [Dioscorea alata]